jgi:glycosyltransferase involved in cell wall biosynthesis
MSIPSLRQHAAAAVATPGAGDAAPGVGALAAGPTLRTIQIPRRFTLDEWGGTETTVLQTSRELRALGQDTRIFTSLALSSRAEEHVHGIEVRRFPYCYPFLGLSADAVRDLDKKGGNLLSLPLLRALLGAGPVDLLHAHSGKRLGGVVRTAAKLRGIPYVVSVHGGHFEIPSGEMDQMLGPIRGRFEWGRPFGALLGARRVLDDAAAVVCVGKDEYEATRAAFPDKRVELLPNGVDAAFFSRGDGRVFRALHGIAPERRLILCVGRIDYQKNQLELVEALAALREERCNAHVVLLGPVTVASYEAKLRARVAELGLADRVTFAPALTWNDPMLANAYAAADVLCLPSLHEPFGMVILEAWAAGVPVVASRVGGIPSFTTDGVDVLHNVPGSARRLRTSLRAVLDDPGLARALAGNGHRRALQHYTWPVIGGRLATIYREVIADWHGGKRR